MDLHRRLQDVYVGVDVFARNCVGGFDSCKVNSGYSLVATTIQYNTTRNIVIGAFKPNTTLLLLSLKVGRLVVFL